MKRTVRRTLTIVTTETWTVTLSWAGEPAAAPGAQPKAPDETETDGRPGVERAERAGGVRRESGGRSRT